MNTAKCPKCDHPIRNIHYEAHEPNSISGFAGSKSFTAVAYPCHHAVGAVPVTWEIRLEELERMTREIIRKVNNIHERIAKSNSDVSDGNII